MKKRTLYAILAMLATAFIFYNSSQNAVKSVAASGGYVAFFVTMFNKIGIHLTAEQLVTPIRKSAHITEFFVQAFLIANSFGGKYKKRVIYILFLGLLTACVDEFIQMFSFGRSSEVRDVFIDFSGTVLGMLIGAVIYKIKRRK